MADVTVVHHNLNKRGGGEAVCMTVLEALQEEHNVTLLTSSRDIDLQDLNNSFNTEVSDVDIETININGVELLKLMKNLDKIEVWKFGYFINILNHGLFNRYCAKSIQDPDLVITTWDEISIDAASIQYIHFPRRYQNLISMEGLSISKPVHELVNRYKSAVKSFAGFKRKRIKSATLLANSQRTASQVEEWYGVSPEVLNPPVDTSGLHSDLSWEQRENGFVFLGRIHPCKKIDQLVEILKQVRKCGHEIHFHVVGPRDEDKPQYYDKIESISKQHDFVTLEGPMYGGDLSQMLKKHKYGINGAPNEQFGMSIAEMVEAGMVPFVPNSGGQRELVGGNSQLMFESVDEAIEKIIHIISTDDVANIKNSFPDIEKRYGKSNFQHRITSLVNKSL